MKITHSIIMSLLTIQLCATEWEIVKTDKLKLDKYNIESLNYDGEILKIKLINDARLVFVDKTNNEQSDKKNYQLKEKEKITFTDGRHAELSIWQKETIINEEKERNIYYNIQHVFDGASFGDAEITTKWVVCFKPKKK